MKKDFIVQFGKYNIVGDSLNSNSKAPNILMLHGAGTSERARFTTLRNFLLENGIGSYAFDCIGHGQTGGNLSDSSLSQRTKQTLAVIQNQKISDPLILVGASMGAYTALKVSQLCNVRALILIVPAMYTKEAYDLPFGPQFSDAIRKPKSWLESDAWDIFSNFKGKILIIKAENDEVIPIELEQKILDCAQKSETKELYLVPQAPHHIMRYLDENPNISTAVFNKILAFVK